MAIATLLALSSLAGSAESRTASASAYHDTNPGATPCGDGSHAVETLRSYFFRSSTDLVVARLDIRYSSYCNTVWTRVTNLTGKGTGYASARRLTADAYIGTYTCPESACFVDSQQENNDVLPGLNDDSWSHQLDVPAGTSINGAAQPQAIRAVGWVTTDSGTTWKVDMAREPLWTHLRYPEPWHNEPAFRDADADRITCDDGLDQCMSWGQTSTGGARTLRVYLDPNLNSAPGSADLGTDMAQQIIPAWNAVSADSPNFEVCSGDCIDHAYVLRVARTDPSFVANPGALALTVETGNSGATITHRTIKVRSDLSFDHGCGTADDGCTGSANDHDDRPLIAHEWGHVYGLGHCDRYSAVMCHVTPSLSSDYAEGNVHWVPQASEIAALKRVYP